MENIFDLSYEYYAHTKRGKEKERLKTHTERTQFYFLKLLENNDGQRMVRYFLNRVFGITEDGLIEKAMELMVGTAIFHDAGKINPAFQREKMENSMFQKVIFSYPMGSRHSAFSSAIYLDYYWNQINEWEISKEQKKILRFLMFLHSYLICYHHSNLASLETYSNKCLEGGELYEIIGFLERGEQTLYKKQGSFSKEQVTMLGYGWEKFSRSLAFEQSFQVYCYLRYMYSLLVTSDYYATAQYMSDLEITDFGKMEEADLLYQHYEATSMVSSIREYEKVRDGNEHKVPKQMNDLRCELFLEVERNWRKEKNQSLFFLEAPTGSGKSNIAMNLSLNMLKDGYKKVFYVYPFNTLVEQNRENLVSLFGDRKEMVSKMVVINSVTPIKVKEFQNKNEEEVEVYYQKALLDRQFLNDPIILTTHVSFFQLLFGVDQEHLYSFSQLVGSVIVMDEIQSYKNTLWTEIMLVLKVMAEFLNMKILIMSATLPDLEYLTEDVNQVSHLVSNREDYFSNPIFRDRVEVCYDLMEEQIDLGQLKERVLLDYKQERKVLIEFINKRRAEEFYQLLLDVGLKEDAYLITGSVNRGERSRILKSIKERMDGLILVATQVVEAGVDIDMDVGYKDCSKLDSEEQFLGRINRSCKRNGKAYFFQLDEAKKIYKNDFRINQELTLQCKEMQVVLAKKQFELYYKRVMDLLKRNWNTSVGRQGIMWFYQNVKELDFGAISLHMKLLDEENCYDSVVICTKLETEDGQKLDGLECWKRYLALLRDYEMSFAKKQILLSEVRSQLSYFIYEVRMQGVGCSDRIGDLYCIEDGELYFENGVFIRERLE